MEGFPLCRIVIFFSILISPNLEANSAPSNDVIYQMLLDQRKEISSLKKSLETVRLREAKLRERLDVTVEKASISEANSDTDSGDYVKFNHAHTYAMLDPTTNRNKKQLYLLEQFKKGNVDKDSFYLGAAITPIANYQRSNTEGKFGYLMRHPTSNNQNGKDVSEAVLHSSQINFTANYNGWISAYGELLYDPEQSFGKGTIITLNRNQIQLRRGYLLFGDLNEYPVYAAVGKMATPFGLTDTVNPFTASTVWHAFGGLSYGALFGFSQDGLNLSYMLGQGGAQFRAANANVNGTSTPSKLNNHHVDINYTYDFKDYDLNAMIGGSFQKASAYCQAYPVSHFLPCDKDNAAYGGYARINWNNFTLQGEYIETAGVWPGTHNPTAPLNVFAAHEVQSFSVGGRYSALDLTGQDVRVSAEFSRFIAGPDGAPWESQDQFVLGAAYFYEPSVKLFTEYIHTAGYAPLNAISGALDGSTTTHSDLNAESNIILFGANAAF
jgi:hypothetical protein